MRIFINYRREDSESITGRIDDHLRDAFGHEEVFRDIDSIPTSGDFPAHLQTALEQCDICIAVVGVRWASSRIHKEGDFVRKELEAVLERGIPVIPVLVEGAKVPEPTQVPPTLVPLLRRQVTKVDSGADFHFHIRRLIDSIRKIRAALRKDVLQEIWTPPGMPEHTELITIVPSTSIVEYADPRDSHGDYVGTRGRHTLWLPSRYRLGMHLVTNAFFREFVADRGYESDAYWPNGGNRHSPVGAPGALDHHPVAGVCFFEAMAFVNWLRDKHPTPNWSWQLPTEDAWEFAARAEDGRNYPWGTTWSANCCNSRDAGLNGTSDVSRYPAGRGPFGHFDLAGNLWEPVQTSDQSSELCTLRGGSFTNTSAEVRAHLRLHHVRKSLGARDFGFRVAQAFDPRS